MLRQQDIAFLQQRQRMLRAWPFVAAILLLGILGLMAWIYLQSPLLIDPRAVTLALESGSLDKGTVTLLALLTPVLVLSLCVLIVVLIFFGFAFFNNEGRYQAIIAALLSTGKPS